jgi:hypothetical protein
LDELLRFHSEVPKNEATHSGSDVILANITARQLRPRNINHSRQHA